MANEESDCPSFDDSKLSQAVGRVPSTYPAYWDRPFVQLIVGIIQTIWLGMAVGTGIGTAAGAILGIFTLLAGLVMMWPPEPLVLAAPVLYTLVGAMIGAGIGVYCGLILSPPVGLLTYACVIGISLFSQRPAAVFDSALKGSRKAAFIGALTGICIGGTFDLLSNVLRMPFQVTFIQRNFSLPLLNGAFLGATDPAGISGFLAGVCFGALLGALRASIKQKMALIE